MIRAGKGGEFGHRAFPPFFLADSILSDGNSITVYKPSEEGTKSVLGNESKDLVSDKQGNIFFISDGTLIRYDLRKEQFSSLQRKAGCLHAQGHDVWTATRDSVFKWDSGKEQFSFVYRLETGLRISALHTDGNGSLWVGTVKGLYHIDDLKNPVPVCVIPQVNVYSLYGDSRGRMWVAAYRQGMYRVEREAVYIPPFGTPMVEALRS